MNKTASLYEAIPVLRDFIKQGQASWLSAIWDRNQKSVIQPKERPDWVRDYLGDDDRLIYDLFYRGDNLPLVQVRNLLGTECVDFLDNKKILTQDSDNIKSSGLLLRPRSGFNVFTGSIEWQDGSPTTVVHLGIDSLILAEMISCLPPVQRAAEICVGSGILSLALSNIADQVVGVELNPLVADIARINIEIADKSDRINVQDGDLFTPLNGEKFDLIVCNPPFVPSMEDPSKDRVGAGGEDGLEIVRKFLVEGIHYLTSGGRLCVLYGALGNQQEPFIDSQLEQIAMNNYMQIDFFELQEAMPINRFWFPVAMQEDRLRRVRENQVAAKRMGATHYFVGIAVAKISRSPSYQRYPLFTSAREDFTRGIKEVRQKRHGDSIGK